MNQPQTASARIARKLVIDLSVMTVIGLVLAMIGAGDGMNALIAWIYVGLRIIHSLVQVTANVVMVRFVLFALSSVALIALSVNAAMLVFGTHM